MTDRRHLDYPLPYHRRGVFAHQRPAPEFGAIDPLAYHHPILPVDGAPPAPLPAPRRGLCAYHDAINPLQLPLLFNVHGRRHDPRIGAVSEPLHYEDGTQFSPRISFLYLMDGGNHVVFDPQRFLNYNLITADGDYAGCVADYLVPRSHPSVPPPGTHDQHRPRPATGTDSREGDHGTAPPSAHAPDSHQASVAHSVVPDSSKTPEGMYRLHELHDRYQKGWAVSSLVHCAVLVARGDTKMIRVFDSMHEDLNLEANATGHAVAQLLEVAVLPEDIFILESALKVCNQSKLLCALCCPRTLKCILERWQLGDALLSAEWLLHPKACKALIEELVPPNTLRTFGMLGFALLAGFRSHNEMTSLSRDHHLGGLELLSLLQVDSHYFPNYRANVEIHKVANVLSKNWSIRLQWSARLDFKKVNNEVLAEHFAAAFGGRLLTPNSRRGPLHVALGPEASPYEEGNQELTSGERFVRASGKTGHPVPSTEGFIMDPTWT